MKLSIKKWMPIASVVVFVLLAIGLMIYHKWPKNIFDELQWETVKIEYHLQDSHLLNEEFGSRKWYDFGQVSGIGLDNYDVNIAFWPEDELIIYIYEYEETADGRKLTRSVSYEYSISTRKLVGGQPVEYLIEHFLADYFAYCEANGIKTGYSVEDLGKFDMEIVAYRDQIYE